MAFKKDFLVISAGRLTSALIALVSIRAITTFLTPEQYGELSLLITVQMFCGLFLVNPVGQYINLHTHSWWDDGTLTSKLKLYQRYILLVSLVGVFVVFLLNKQASLDHLLLTSLSMFLMIFAGTFNATLIPILNMLGFRAASVLWSILTILIGLIFSISFSFFVSSATVWFLGQALGMLIGWLGANYYLGQHNKLSKHSILLLNKKIALSYCLPLALATGFMWLQLSGYRFLINNYWGLAQLGFFALGFQLVGQIWSLVESLAMQFLYPLFFRTVSNYKNKDVISQAYSDLLNTLIPLYFIVSGLIIISAPYLLKVLVSDHYSNATIFLSLGACVEMCRVLGNLLSNAAHVKRNTKTLIFPYFTGALLSMVFIYFAGVNSFEIKWAALGLLVASIAMLIVMVLTMRHQLKFMLDSFRCICSGLIMVLMFIFSESMPIFDTWLKSFLMLIFLVVFCSFIIFIFLRTNPAVHRLLKVQLRKI